MAEHLIWESFQGEDTDTLQREGALRYLDSNLEDFEYIDSPLVLNDSQRDWLSYLMTRVSEAVVFQGKLERGEKHDRARDVCLELGLPNRLLERTIQLGIRVALREGRDLGRASRFYTSQIPQVKK